MAQEQLLTPTQVAERLQIQETTVTRWLREGYLRGFKLGKEWRIGPTDLEEFVEHQANRAHHSDQAQSDSRKSG
jgi:excisionase family DNA binding protein